MERCDRGPRPYGLRGRCPFNIPLRLLKAGAPLSNVTVSVSPFGGGGQRTATATNTQVIAHQAVLEAEQAIHLFSLTMRMRIEAYGEGDSAPRWSEHGPLGLRRGLGARDASVHHCEPAPRPALAPRDVNADDETLLRHAPRYHGSAAWYPCAAAPHCTRCWPEWPAICSRGGRPPINSRSLRRHAGLLARIRPARGRISAAACAADQPGAALSKLPALLSSALVSGNVFQPGWPRCRGPVRAKPDVGTSGLRAVDGGPNTVPMWRTATSRSGVSQRDPCRRTSGPGLVERT